MMPNTDLRIVLDDVGCNGTETSLLECLPQHNCKLTETAGVRCLLKGIHNVYYLVLVEWLCIKDKLYTV